MANSPRPGLWTLEKSMDYGKTWKAWQHFSDTPSDCETYFGRESLKPITADDDVICTTDYSKIVPLEGGEVWTIGRTFYASVEYFFLNLDPGYALEQSPLCK